ncbi:MAG: integral rane sensor signal transduction histidine kinase [Thermoleophilia bacterium]|nr:integral rane sensor signal transduction histidine kinase [Thermoleophilia bacterium]
MIRRARSVRVRVALAFTVAMVVVLASIGTYVYVATGRALDHATGDALAARLADATAIVAGAPDRATIEALDFGDRDDTFVQVVDERGRAISDHGGDNLEHGLPGRLVDGASARPTSSTLVVERDEPPVRLLLERAHLRDGTPVIVVTGASVRAQHETLDALRGVLLIGGLIGAACAALVGYVAVAMSLRPVERMRRQAAAITPEDFGRRLDVPPARDELGRLAVTLNEMLARLDHGVQRERQLTADASHELRTPLALLKTEIEVALATPPTVEGLRDTLRSSEAEVDRLIQLAESLLLLAQSDGDQLPIVRSPVPLRRLFDDLSARYARRATREDRPLVLNGLDARVDIDSVRIAQALGNLIDNAYRHGRGAVEVRAEFDGRRDLVLAVHDEGDGIAPEFAEDAFERFSRDDSARTTSGAGLGLAIVRAIAAAHGGTASIEGEPGASWVQLRIPGDHDPQR